MAEDIINKLIQEGNFFLERGRYEQASKKYSEALAKSPRNVGAHYGLTICLLNLKDYAEAERMLKEGMLAFPHDDDYYDQAATHYLTFQQYKEALEIADRWIKHNPSTGKAFSMKSRIMLWGNTKKKKEILEFAKEGLKLNPVNAFCHEVMGDALWECNKDSKGASEHYKQALKLDPHNDALHNNYGVFLLNSGQAKSALDEFKMALRINPTLTISNNNISQALVAANPFLGWSYKLSVWLSKIPYIGGLGFISLFIVSRVIFELGRANIIPEAIGSIVLLLYVLFAVYTFLGNRIILYFIKKGWIA